MGVSSLNDEVYGFVVGGGSSGTELIEEVEELAKEDSILELGAEELVEERMMTVDVVSTVVDNTTTVLVTINEELGTNGLGSAALGKLVMVTVDVESTAVADTTTVLVEASTVDSLLDVDGATELWELDGEDVWLLAVRTMVITAGSLFGVEETVAVVIVMLTDEDSENSDDAWLL